MDEKTLAVIEAIILSFIGSTGLWAALTAWLSARAKKAQTIADGEVKKSTAALDSDIKSTQSAQQVLLKNQQEDRATTSSTIDHLRKEVDASNSLTANANAQATLAFAQSVEATKENTKLQLIVQELKFTQAAFQSRIDVLETNVAILTDTNTGLTAQIGGLTKTNDLLLAQVTDLKNLNKDLTAQILTLRTTNTELQSQIKQLVDVVQRNAVSDTKKE